MAPPCNFIRCFTRDKQGGLVKMPGGAAAGFLPVDHAVVVRVHRNLQGSHRKERCCLSRRPHRQAEHTRPGQMQWLTSAASSSPSSPNRSSRPATCATNPIIVKCCCSPLSLWRHLCHQTQRCLMLLLSPLAPLALWQAVLSKLRPNQSDRRVGEALVRSARHRRCQAALSRFSLSFRTAYCTNFRSSS